MQWTIFEGPRNVSSGTLPELIQFVRQTYGTDAMPPVLVFDDATGRQVDLAFHAPAADAAPPAPRGPGRPKLGVVAREVTLLPRHWEWLAAQPGGASVALRRIVDEARKANEERDRTRQAREAAYRFITAMAGNAPGYEEAARALFAGDRARFTQEAAAWPADVRAYATRLAEAAWDQER
ncbi:MAG: DUF2239 family protein [Bryobacterales bacterium]|nr:DUF2239 family protein [Bryobacterales bacterium]